LASTLAELGRQTDAQALLESVAEQTDARRDDMAACLLTVAGGAAAPSVLLEQLELDGVEAASDRAERFLLACGVTGARTSELANASRALAGEGGPVLIEAHLSDGSPHVELHRNNVAPLLTRQARSSLGAGASR
ncbi:MAG TPA: hypothetical protein VIG42_04085, partial [Solirubrobacteraceae bacterium]